MTQENLDFGASPDDPNAESLYDTFQKVQNNFDELYSLESWVEATYQNGWADGDTTPTARFRKDRTGNLLYLAGHMNGASRTGDIAFTLPSDYRPVSNVLIPVIATNSTAGSGNGQAKIRIIRLGAGTDPGAVVVLAADDYSLISLDGVVIDLSA